MSRKHWFLSIQLMLAGAPLLGMAACVASTESETLGSKQSAQPSPIVQFQCDSLDAPAFEVLGRDFVSGRYRRVNQDQNNIIVTMTSEPVEDRTDFGNYALVELEAKRTWNEANEPNDELVAPDPEEAGFRGEFTVLWQNHSSREPSLECHNDGWRFRRPFLMGFGGVEGRPRSLGIEGDRIQIVQSGSYYELSADLDGDVKEIGLTFDNDDAVGKASGPLILSECTVATGNLPDCR